MASKNNEVSKEQDVMECVMSLARLTRRQPRPGTLRTHSEHQLMRILKRHGGESSRAIAQRMDIRPSSLSGMADRLERAGVVERRRDEQDARVIRLFLTEAGLAEAKRNAKEAREARAAFADCLTEEEKLIFCLLCNRISERIRQQYPDE